MASSDWLHVAWSYIICLIHFTLFTGLSRGLLDGEVKGSILVSHEELAKDGVLVVCRPSQGGSGAGRRRGP